MSFKYFYGGDYRTVVVPVGGNVVLDAAIAGVYPITVITGDIISAATFVGGAFIPPDGWDGPPPPDWAPYQPVVYDSVPVDFVNADDQTAVVDRVTMVGHDDSLPEGQRDVFTINDSTVARGQVTPAPDGGPPQVKVQQTQPLPGVSPWNDGKQYVNTQVTPLAKQQSDNHLPWIIGSVVALLSALGGVAGWGLASSARRCTRGDRADQPADGQRTDRVVRQPVSPVEQRRPDPMEATMRRVAVAAAVIALSTATAACGDHSTPVGYTPPGSSSVSETPIAEGPPSTRRVSRR